MGRKDAKEVMQSVLVAKQAQFVLSLMWTIALLPHATLSDLYSLTSSMRVRLWLVLFATAGAMHELALVWAFVEGAPSMPLSLCVGGPLVLLLTFVWHAEAVTLEFVGCVWGIAAHLATTMLWGEVPYASELVGLVGTIGGVICVCTAKYLANALPHNLLCLVWATSSLGSIVVSNLIYDRSTLCSLFLHDTKEAGHNIGVGLLMLAYQVLLVVSAKYLHEVSLTLFLQTIYPLTWYCGALLTLAGGGGIFTYAPEEKNTALMILTGLGIVVGSVCVQSALKAARSTIGIEMMSDQPPTVGVPTRSPGATGEG
jgi:hypothetical protein